MRKTQNIWLTLVMAVLLAGCAAKQPQVEARQDAPAAPVQAAAVQAAETPDYFFHDIVDVDFVKPLIGIPRPENTLVIDSRPYQPKHVEGHIPTSISIPDSKFEEMTDKLPGDKSALLVFYCEGPPCKLSHNSAKKAEKLGYTNVKVFAEGFPQWIKAGYPAAVGIEHVHGLIASGKPYMLVDSRPANKFLEGAIPTAISIPDSQFEGRSGMLPADKGLTLIFYCGGYDCPLSHKSAEKAKGLGYTNLMIADAGYPAWTKLYGTSGAVAMKQGEDEGAIDQAQFEQILKERPESIMLIDVRDPDEYAACHLPGAINMPVNEVEKKMDELPSDKPIVFVCSTGARSGESFYMAQDMRPELKDVYYLEANVSCSKDGSYTITPNK